VHLVNAVSEKAFLELGIYDGFLDKLILLDHNVLKSQELLFASDCLILHLLFVLQKLFFEIRNDGIPFLNLGLELRQNFIRNLFIPVVDLRIDFLFLLAEGVLGLNPFFVQKLRLLRNP